MITIRFLSKPTHKLREYKIPLEKALLIPLIRDIYNEDQNDVIELPRGEEAFEYIYSDFKSDYDEIFDCIDDFQKFQITYGDTIEFIPYTNNLYLKLYNKSLTEITEIYHSFNYFGIDMKPLVDVIQQIVIDRHCQKVENFFKKYKQYLSNASFNGNTSVHESFFTYTGNQKIYSHPNISEKFIIENKAYELCYILKNPNITESYIKSKPEISLLDICKYYWNGEYIEKRFDEFLPYHMTAVFQNKSLSCQFYEKFIVRFGYNDVSWSSLSKNKNLSEEFVRKYNNRFFILPVNNYSESFCEQFINSPNMNWNNICANQNLPNTFFEKYFEIWRTNRKNWEIICKNPNIPQHFFEKHMDSFDDKLYSHLCLNSGLSEDFFNSLDSSKLDWENLCSNINLSESFFEKNFELLKTEKCWKNLCGNPNLSVDFFEKIINNTKGYKQTKNIDWEILSRNPFKIDNPFDFLEIPTQQFVSIDEQQPVFTFEIMFVND